MYTILQLSNILGLTPRRIIQYIEEGKLKASKREKTYFITTQDYDTFYNKYYRNRHKQKGKKIANIIHLELLANFVLDIQNKDIDFLVFYNKFRDVSSLIPPLDCFLLLKRNMSIEKDSEHMTYQEIAEKYSVHIQTIKNIMKKSKERK